MSFFCFMWLTALVGYTESPFSGSGYTVTTVSTVSFVNINTIQLIFLTSLKLSRIMAKNVMSQK
jgi:hypothetical protein